MTNFEHTVPKGRVPGADSFYMVMLMFAAIFAIILTFVLASSAVEVATKTRGFSAIIALFLVTYVCLHLRQAKRGAMTAVIDSAAERESRTANGLRGLDEAHEFFAGSIKSGDMFRLVSSRIRQLVSFRTSTLLLLDETRSHLRVAESDGPDSEKYKDLIFGVEDDPVSRCFSGRSVEISHSVPEASGGVGSIVAIPMLNGAEIFGVLHLYFDSANRPNEKDASIFEAIGTRVAPLVLSSISLERSIANALTDATTELPNERAFHLIMETQIAESQRKRDERPLTILAIDVKNFAEINKRCGHAAGDRVLNFVGQIIRDNLRQMDFLARSQGDEFLAVLPTASKEISHDVIARIHTGFFGRKLKVTDEESVEVELNFGWAAFGNDGETPNALLATALLRKEQSKSAEPPKVLWFAQELSN